MMKSDMDTKAYVDELRKFLAGDLPVAELENFIDERLFKLRQAPELAEEQQILSAIELLLHEAKEGFRSLADLREYIRLGLILG